jgi:TatD DNase family protein
MLIDSHCHLSFPDALSSPLEDILERAYDAGLSHMVTIGAGDEVNGNFEAVKLARKYPQISATVGIHPHDAKLVDDQVMTDLEELAQDENVVAIGEIGLDWFYEHSEKEVQEKVFRDFIRLAKKLNKPIVIHDRGAGDRTYEILKEEGIEKDSIVIHCFTGTMDLAKKYLDLGCYISFTGIVTFKKADELREVVKMVPVERMLIETDTPYLAPIPHRGRKNEPAFVELVAKKIAEIKGLSFDDVARITSINAKRFFNLPLPDLTTSIVYAIRNSLYLNITNRCTLACRFCPKFVDYEVKGYYLKLQKEPTVEEVLGQIGDPSSYDEVVFCGYGEPTRRIDDLLEISKNLKENYPQLKIRINTDGLGNLVHERNIIPDLAKYIDALSVSLNAQNAQIYAKHCPSRFKEAAYPAVKEFIKEAALVIPDVTASVVGLPEVDEEECREIATHELGAKFRYRPLDVVG